jgi:hypothetical protein
MTVDQSHSSGDTVAKILEISGEWRHKDYHKDVRGYLNRNLPQRWIGRTVKEVDAVMRGPPRSPDLTPCDFFFWSFVKDTVFVPPFPANVQDLRNRITAAVALVDRVLLTRVWNEMDYRTDVCRVSKGGHTEHLWGGGGGLGGFSIGVRVTMIRCVVYFFRIFKMFHGLTNNPVL